jgi:hypothetical protein
MLYVCSMKCVWLDFTNIDHWFSILENYWVGIRWGNEIQEENCTGIYKAHIVPS